MRVVMLVSNNIERDARVRKEAASLASAGHEVHVIGMGHNYPNNVSEEPYTFHLSEALYKGKPLLPRLGHEDVWRPLRVLVNLTITRMRTKSFYSDYSGDGRYSQHILKPEMASYAASLQPDVVHAHDLDTLAPGYEAAQRSGALLVYDSHELYTEQHALDPELVGQFVELEAELFPKIDAFVTVSPSIGRLLTKKYNSNLEPVVLYNGGPKTLANQNEVTSPVKFFFQGSFASDRNNLELIEAFDALRGVATLTLQGWGQDEKVYARLITDLGLEENVFMIPACQPHEVVEQATHYDVGVINSKCIDENFKNTLPNKLFDYMAAGLAVASTDLPPVKEIIEKHEAGITFEQAGVEHTASTLKKLATDLAAIRKYKENAAAAAPLYTWDEQEKKVIALYDELAIIREAR